MSSEKNLGPHHTHLMVAHDSVTNTKDYT